MRGMPKARGVQLLEMTVALLLILVAICIAGSSLAQATLHDRLLRRRLAAREAVMIGLERVRTMEAHLLPKAGRTVDFPLPPESAKRLPRSTGQLTVSSVDGTPALLRVRIEVLIPGTKEIEEGEIVLRTLSGEVTP